ncbi:MAG TPA: VWA domain-containing protein [Silvibacterium sp.]|nr:VWA domain-containing protein [Silvibacterium sp.]
MTKRYLLGFWLCVALFLGSGAWTTAQDNQAQIRVNVNLVQLNVAVTDNKGEYVTGLRPQDFVITEDRIPEKIATFEAGGEPTETVTETTSSEGVPVVQTTEQASDVNPAPAPVSRYSDANVFILFDTSNYMYRGFVFAQDAIAGFVRSLQSASKVAFYSYSRDLSRAAPLTTDRSEVLRGVRSTVAGDDAALYNCLLLTVKDAARITGRKVVVVFSNGPDNASMVPPEDVAELAQSTGTIIYMVSTEQAQLEPISTAVFERMSKATGGKAYFAKSWRDETRAFASIRDDLSHLYSLSYYPQSNSNRGWRTITVKLVGKDLQRYHVRTRDGYRLQQVNATRQDFAESAPAPAAK